MKPGEVYGIYIHCEAHGDEGIVYDNTDDQVGQLIHGLISSSSFRRFLGRMIAH